MPRCPVCSTEIKDDFGLVTCSSCGAQVMVEIDGDSSGAISSDISQIIQQDVLSNLESDATQAVNVYNVPLPDEAAVSRTPIRHQHIATPDLSDIADFGNSEASQGREGMLRFNIFITGIDSANIRQMIFDALTDDRFLWDAEQIMDGVNQGQLQLKEITAVKSAILVQKLRTVPVEIRWEQYAIYQN